MGETRLVSHNVEFTWGNEIMLNNVEFAWGKRDYVVFRGCENIKGFVVGKFPNVELAWGNEIGKISYDSLLGGKRHVKKYSIAGLPTGRRSCRTGGLKRW